MVGKKNGNLSGSGRRVRMMFLLLRGDPREVCGARGGLWRVQCREMKKEEFGEKEKK